MCAYSVLFAHHGSTSERDKTYAIFKADDGVIDAFLGTNAVGAKAEADATKKVVTAIENFMVLMVRVVQFECCGSTI